MPSADRKSFLLRIDPRLWAELEAWAQQDLRSINGQIEFILRDAVGRRKKAAAPPPTEPRSSGEKGSASA